VFVSIVVLHPDACAEVERPIALTKPVAATAPTIAIIVNIVVVFIINVIENFLYKNFGTLFYTV